MITRRACGYRNQRGISYVEVLVAMTLIAVALVPAIDALRVGVSSTTLREAHAVRHFELMGRIERVAAQPFVDLDAAAAAVGDPAAPTLYSDGPGTPDRLLVFLARYDIDNADADGNRFTDPEPDVMWVRVQVENTIHAFETLVIDI